MSSKKAEKELALRKLYAALYVVFGAIASNETLRAGNFLSGGAVVKKQAKGKLQYKVDAEPSEQELKKVFALANAKVAENAPIHFDELARDDAVHKYKDTKVNGCTFYAGRAVPATIKTIKTATIENFCLVSGLGEPVAVTGEIGSIVYLSHTFEEKSGKLVVWIGVGDAPAGSASASASGAATAKSARAAKSATNVQDTALRLLDLLMPAAADNGAARRQALARLEQELYLFKNAAYAAGLKSVSK